MYYEVEYLANEKMKRLYFSRRLDSKSFNFTLIESQKQEKM